jgi:hypothetical protein
VASGNVGIGTTAPEAKLDVQGDTYIGTGGGSPMLILRGGVAFKSLQDAAGTLYFWNGPQTQVLMAIQDAGNVGIGNTGPATKLDVSGTVRVADGGETCSSTVKGGIRFTSSSTLQICNGTAWQQIVTQTPGSTANVTASGPPVSAGIYSFSSVTCTYSPTYGTCSNINDGVWPPDGTLDDSSSACLNLQTWEYTAQSVIFDLGSVKTINNVYISGDDSSFYGFVAGLSFSTDGISYSSSTTITPTGSGGSTRYNSATLSPGVTARYIMMINNAGTNYYAGRNEVCQFAVGP